MSNAKLNIPWTRTHEALLEQQIMPVRSRLKHYAGRMARGSADTEDIDAHEFYTGLLNVLVSMRQPVTAKTLGAFTIKTPTKDEVWSEPFPSLTKFDAARDTRSERFTREQLAERCTCGHNRSSHENDRGECLHTRPLPGCPCKAFGAS